ncbi:MutS2 family protein [Lachnospiraceae bacterium MD335]|nr:MutS2 family protein [Lachnospiraceae bacterium MD335]
MNEKALRILEYHKIINLLTDKATSAPGKELCHVLKPMTDLEKIEEAQRQTADAFSRLVKGDRANFSGNTDISYSIKALEIGSALSAAELLKIAASLACAARAKAFSRTERDDEIEDSLQRFFANLEPLTPLQNEINRCILSEEEIADDASAALKHIRRSISLTNDKIHSQLTNMVNGSYRTYLQDAVITMRNNRYCIPVKSEHKGNVPGMIHDQSATGSTLFIEPAVIVNLNNQLKELAMQEQDEIERILAELSANASDFTVELANNYRLLTILDFIFARAALAIDMNASRPLFNNKRYINIRKGRHPLLNKKTVVPIDVHLGADFDLLIVTGPNTGGKTVSLKTVGLFTLMGQSGLHIPALDRSELGVFTEVYADIGDEQSIEQNLSTFSAHMTNTISILDSADEHSLCIFDELGAGTDPTEGAALAIAILKHLHGRGIRTMATTHYSELKVFALTTPYVENACCEFDVETLRPTYRLLIGIAGKSNAFAISSKLGLSDEIIASAKEHISEEEESFEDLLANLEDSRRTIEKERSEIQSYKTEIASLKQRLEQKQERLDTQKDKILREANEEARRILQDAKDVADETIRNFQKANSQTSIKDLEKARTKVRDKISEKNNKLSITDAKPTHKLLKPSQLKLGDFVKVVTMGLKGTVSTLPDAKGDLFVQCGIIRSKVNIKDLVLAQEETMSGIASYKKRYGGMNSGSGSNRISMSKAATLSPEINLLGKTVDEAIAELDKYLDDAYLSHAPSVRIVHGKGTGALRQAVSQHLKRVSYVKSFHLGEYGEGDAGVTIVDFK